MNRVDVVDLDVDLVDVDLDVDLVDVDLDVDLVDVDLVDLGKRRFPFLLSCPAGGLDLRELCFGKKLQFFKVEAARKATSTKREIVIFQNRGRPQGNIDKKGYRVFPKSRPIFL